MPEQQPPMEVSEEATAEQLDLATRQGDAYGQALHLMATQVADSGGEQRAGEFLIGYAVEKAEGMWHRSGQELEWQEPGEENAHVEVVVRDAADGRFVPGCEVSVSLVGPDGNEHGPHRQDLLWHPMLYHYGRNWKLPGDGRYTLRVHVEPPSFPRHDRVNGRRFTDPVDVEFEGVEISTGQK